MFGMNVLNKKIDRAVREYQKLDTETNTIVRGLQ